MPGRPKKGRRFGGSSAHQKAIMGNLVASLIAAEAIVTTEAKAKAMRPVAEKIITKAKKGGLHNHRQILAFVNIARPFVGKGPNVNTCIPPETKPDTNAGSNV